MGWNMGFLSIRARNPLKLLHFYPSSILFGGTIIFHFWPLGTKFREALILLRLGAVSPWYHWGSGFLIYPVQTYTGMFQTQNLNAFSWANFAKIWDGYGIFDVRFCIFSPVFYRLSPSFSLQPSYQSHFLISFMQLTRTTLRRNPAPSSLISICLMILTDILTAISML